MSNEMETAKLVEADTPGRANRKPPGTKVYRVMIDGIRFEFDQRRVTGRQILERAGKTPPERFQLDKRVRGSEFVPVGLAQIIDLKEPGLEVFETFPLDETEG